MNRLALIGMAAVVVVGCNNDQKVGVRKEPPVVTITEPTPGTEVPLGTPLQFVALAQTLDGTALTDLTHTWVTGGVEMCSSDVVPANGEASCVYAFEDVGPHTVQVTVTDPQSETAQAEVGVEVILNNAPTISIDAPAADALFEPTDPVILTATVDDVEDLADELAVTVNSSVDGLLNLPAEPTSDGTWSQTTFLSKGLHVLTFRVEDTAGQTAQATTTIGVNSRPTAPSVAISPDPAISGQSLSATILTPSTDPDGDPLTYIYDWYQDGNLFKSGTSPNVPSGITVRDEFWEVIVTPEDTFGAGSTGTAFITIQNSPPSIDPTVLITPTVPGTNDDLVVTPQNWTDADGDPELYTFAWYRNGTLDGSAVTDTYPASKTSRGDSLYAVVTPRDAYDSGTSQQSITVSIENAPPTEPVIGIDPAIPGTNSDLFCQILQSSYDSDGDIVTYDYEWFQNGVPAGVFTNTVTSNNTSIGDTWECRVTPTDGFDDGQFGSATVSIQDIAPPDVPVFDYVPPYTNDDVYTFTGTCEADCDLTLYCSDSSTNWTETTTCTGGDEFSVDTDLTSGETTSCYAECSDGVNTSDPSATVEVEECGTVDTYEDDLGYGDLPQDAIDAWSTLPDDNSSSILIQGNLLDSVDQDWYLVSTSDNKQADISAGRDAYNLDVEVTQGSSIYSVLVYKGGYSSNNLECPTEVDGYTEYNDYSEDLGESGSGGGDMGHSAPSDVQACGAAGDPTRNECTDFSNDYYIRVLRDTSQALSCQPYQITITNGGSL